VLLEGVKRASAGHERTLVGPLQFEVTPSALASPAPLEELDLDEQFGTFAV
jgi:hypothetical protein